MDARRHAFLLSRLPPSTAPVGRPIAHFGEDCQARRGLVRRASGKRTDASPTPAITLDAETFPTRI